MHPITPAATIEPVAHSEVRARTKGESVTAAQTCDSGLGWGAAQIIGVGLVLFPTF